jgi:thymidylate kinase
MTIIVIEGIDGSGKTTLAKRLATELGYTYRHYPYDLDQKLANHNLQLAMAYDLIENPPTPDQDWVLDRYLPSSLVYGMPLNLYLQTANRLPMANISILLDVSAQVSLDRAIARAEVDPLGYDLASLGVKQELINGYHQLGWDIVINANLTQNMVYSQLLTQLKEKRLCC